MPVSDELREELAQIAPRRRCCRLAELSALFHASGAWHLRGGSVAVHLDLAAPAAARRAFALLRDDYAVYPTEAVGEALNASGAKLGKSPAQVGEAVLAQMKTKTTAAKPFTLKRLDNGQNVSLSDYKGKVVLMDFWFPDCGNCRQAFPLLQQIATDYKQKDFVVLSVNGLKDEEAYAWPYLKGKGYDFVPLGADNDFAQNVYGVSGYPTTFLIGPDGQIYSRPSVRDEGSMRSTELMIDMLLGHRSDHGG